MGHEGNHVRTRAIYEVGPRQIERQHLLPDTFAEQDRMHGECDLLCAGSNFNADCAPGGLKRKKNERKSTEQGRKEDSKREMAMLVI